jgi:hypothetical protein
MAASNRHARLEQLGHILAGALILLKSSVVGEHHFLLGLILFALGALFVFVAVFHHRLNARFPLAAHRVLFLLESFALWVVVYEMVAEHKHYLQYAYALAAIMYLLLAILFPRLRASKRASSTSAH